jgi:hypothetical protein
LVVPKAPLKGTLSKKVGRPVNTAPVNRTEPAFGVVFGLLVAKIEASIPASCHLL